MEEEQVLILGNVFLRKYLSIFNIDNKTIGLVKAK